MYKKFLKLVSKDSNLVIETSRLVLEPITTDHAEKMHGLLEDEKLYTYIPQNPTSIESLKTTYLLWQYRKPLKGTEIWLNWAARIKNSNTYIGHFQSGWDQKNGFYVAYLVGSDFQRQGFARESLNSILNFLKHKMNADTIRAWVDTRNLASIQLLKSLHFNEVGIIKNADEFKGSMSDEFIFELNMNNYIL